MKSKLIFLILGILLIGTGIYLLTTQQPASGGNNFSPNTSSGNTAGAQTNNVTISGFTFSPSSLTINVGDTVIWTNKDSSSHTITSDSGTELSSSSFGRNGIYSHTFTTAGTFAYHCSIHSNMKGTIIVE